MKKIYMAFSYLTLLFIMFLFSSGSIYAGGHDSLLFDAATTPTSITQDCYVRVIYAKGSTNGTYYVTKTYQICGEWDTSRTTETGKLSPMNELKLGEEISTGENSSLEMQFPDGSQIRLGPNSKIKITGDMCQTKTFVQMMIGCKLWTKVKKLLGSQKYEVKTERAVHGVRGTEFTVETTADGDITTVYEGSVEVSPSIKGVSSEEDGKAYAKLTEDYQAGKITMEEFVKKTQEYQENISKKSDNMKSKMCEAGYSVTVTDKAADPVPLESGSNWFDDVNFK